MNCPLDVTEKNTNFPTLMIFVSLKYHIAMIAGLLYLIGISNKLVFSKKDLFPFAGLAQSQLFCDECITVEPMEENDPLAGEYRCYK